MQKTEQSVVRLVARSTLAKEAGTNTTKKERRIVGQSVRNNFIDYKNKTRY